MSENKNPFKRGTAACGLLCGVIAVFVLILMMTIGFWKTILIGVVFLAGFVFGVEENLLGTLKSALNKIVPSQDSKVLEIKRPQETVKEEEKE